jgi:hypothetical protein
MALQRFAALLVFSARRLGAATHGAYGAVAADEGFAVDAKTAALAATLAVVVGVFLFAPFLVLDLVAARDHRGGNPDHQEHKAQHYNQKTFHNSLLPAIEPPG